MGTFAGVTEPARVVGRVEQLWVYPVKSLAGTAVPAAEVVADRAGRRPGVDGRRRRRAVRCGPRTRRRSPTLDPGDADDARPLSAALGRPVRLAAAPRRSPASRRCTWSPGPAIERAAAGEVPEGCSADDPRANLVLTLDGDERSWVGRELRVGDAVLEVTRTPKHCLGVYADVRQPGRITVGDAVLL